MTDRPTVVASEKPLRAVSIWDLPRSLLEQPHRFRKRAPRQGRERKHQAAILAFIYRNRFATASQVQRRFTNILKSDRTARRHLAEMQESLGYLDLVPTPSPLWPKVYSVSWRGMRKLTQAFQKKESSWKPQVNDRRRIGFSIHHVYHELACTEFLLQVNESAKAMGVELLEVQRRSLVKNDAFRLPTGSGGRLVPDGMFLLRTKHGMICTFLELDTGSMSIASVSEKLARYTAWADSELGKQFVIELYRRNGAADPQRRFRIAVICGGNNRADGQQRLGTLIRIAEGLSEPVRGAIWLTTAVAIRDADNVLKRNIWCRIGETHEVLNQTQPFLVSRVHLICNPSVLGHG
jgi:hypothetical protein